MSSSGPDVPSPFGIPSSALRNLSKPLKDKESTSTVFKSTDPQVSSPNLPPEPQSPCSTSSSGSTSTGTSSSSPRPNRYHGPPSTWRTWTQSERDLYASLQRQRAGDLSAHLYNAHWLRRRNSQAAAAAAAAAQQQSWLPRALWYGVDHFPPAWWDAWPVRAELGGEAAWEGLEEAVLGAGLGVARRVWEGRVAEDQDGTGSEKSKGDVSPPAFSTLTNSQSSQLPHSDHEFAHSFSTPVFSADEAASVQLLRPIAHSVISQLDGLLTALSISRRNHYAYSRGNPEGPIEHSGVETEPEPPGRTRRTRPTPRDWSEVLSVAALTGWDRDTLHVTATRCSALFGESMSFVSLEESAPLQAPLDVISYTPEVISAPMDNGDSDDATERAADWSLEDLVCPHTECNRHGERFALRHRLVQHIRQVHKWDPLTEDLSSALDSADTGDFLQPIRRRSGWRGKSRTKGEKTDGAEVKQRKRIKVN